MDAQKNNVALALSINGLQKKKKKKKNIYYPKLPSNLPQSLSGNILTEWIITSYLILKLRLNLQEENKNIHASLLICRQTDCTPWSCNLEHIGPVLHVSHLFHPIAWKQVNFTWNVILFTLSMVNVLKFWTLYSRLHVFWSKFCFLCSGVLEHLVEW